jgi:uncharacterized protein
VIVPDANLLLYAYDSSSTQHAKAKAWVEKTLSGEELVGLPWQTAGAFLRIVTNAKLAGQRMSLEEAASVIDQWLEQPNVRMLAPGPGHWALFRQLMISGQAQGPLMTDAQLAALTVEHGGVLHTTDRDFSRFPGLRCVNPLTA